jgi:hypothetical protein
VRGHWGKATKVFGVRAVIFFISPVGRHVKM